MPSELPSNLVLKKVSPRIWLPFLTIAWGIVTMCLGFVRSYGSFVAVRAVLGMCEGGLLPGMVLYLSGLYTRGELALRIGIFYTAASLSGQSFLPAHRLLQEPTNTSAQAHLVVFLQEDFLPSARVEILRVGDGSSSSKASS